MGPPPLAPPVTAAPAASAQSGPPVFGPLPPLGVPAGAPGPAPIAPPSLGTPSAGFGPMPPINSLGGAGPSGMGASPLGGPPIAPPALGPLPAIGSLGSKPLGAGAPLNSGPLNAPPMSAQGPAPLGPLGPLPPLGPTSPSGPAYSPSSPAGPAVPLQGFGPMPPLGPAQPQNASLGPLPPLGPSQPQNAPPLAPIPPLGPSQPTSAALGPLPPLGPPQGSRMQSQPNAGFANSAGGDPFSSGGGDPFSTGGDPFAAQAPAAQGYAPPTSDSYPAADPFAQSQSGNAPYQQQQQQPPFPQPRQQTIGPNGLMASAVLPARAQTIGPGGGMPSGLPQIKPAATPIAPQVGPQDAWSAQRVEPELEESHTRVVQALGTPRPKFLVTQLDGTEEGEFLLNEGENLVGREVGGMFSKDNLLSGRHATIIVQGQSVWVRDEGSRNGVYARIPRQQHVELADGDQFCIGRIILRFELMPTPDSVGLLHLVVGRDVDKGMFPCRIPRTGITLGRNRADLRFPLDGWVSGLHCQIVPHGPQVMIVDLGSSNGTYQRIRGVRALSHHDALLMGQRIFHLHYG